jgi:hypothetical protein
MVSIFTTRYHGLLSRLRMRHCGKRPIREVEFLGRRMSWGRQVEALESMPCLGSGELEGGVEKLVRD